MDSALKDHRDFAKTIAASAFLHLIAILLALIVYKAEPKRVFFSPVYTVNLVDPGTLRSDTAVKPGNGVETNPSPPVGNEAKKPAANAPVKAAARAKKASAEKAVNIKAHKAKEGASVEEAIKRVSQKVKEKSESELLETKIEAIRKKTETESAETRRAVEEIKKSIDSGPRRTSALGKSGPLLENYAPVTGAGGAVAEDFNIKYRSYLGVIRDRVQQTWAYPEGFAKGNVSVIVSIRIGKKGNLLESWVEKSSGNSNFDESLLDAVKKASPFPPLPQDFEGNYFETGLRFCRGCGD